MQEIAEAEAWLYSLGRANTKKPNYDDVSLFKMLSLVWYRLCFNSSSLGAGVITRYAVSELANNDKKKKMNVLMIMLSVIKNKFNRVESA